VIHTDVAGALKIGDRVGNFQNPIVGPGRKPQFVNGRLQQIVAGGINGGRY